MKREENSRTRETRHNARRESDGEPHLKVHAAPCLLVVLIFETDRRNCPVIADSRNPIPMSKGRSDKRPLQPDHIALYSSLHEPPTGPHDDGGVIFTKQNEHRRFLLFLSPCVILA